MTSTAINWAKLRSEIIAAAVGTVNGLLWDGLAGAQRDVPVRRVFQGDRQTVRFKTAGEIERDKVLRARLGLAPEILATPEGIARLRAAKINPTRSAQVAVTDFRTDRIVGSAAAAARTTGRSHVTQGGTSVGFARTVTRRDRANSWEETGVWFDGDRWHGRRALDRTERFLKDRDDENLLSSRGRYELKSGRAVAQQRIYGGKPKPVVDLSTGRITFVGGDRMGGHPTLGGGLRSTLRVKEATPDQFPVIKGSLIAGDREHDYAKYQELGTRHNAAHPFLRPRLPEWRTKLKARLRRNIGRIGR